MKKMKIFILLVTILGLAVIVFLNSTSGKYYKTYSPDKQYSVYASKYNWENFMFRMTGSSGDASGVVCLYDEIEKKVINKAPISIVWTAEGIEWTENTAYFKGGNIPNILEPWKLPRPIPIKSIEAFYSYEVINNNTNEKTIPEDTAIDLEIYPLNSHQKEIGGEVFSFSPLTDMFRFVDHPDSLVIAQKYLSSDNLESYHTLDSTHRARFLQQKQISENDSVYVYNYQANAIHKSLVKELPLFAYITVYETETVVPQYYYLIGFSFENVRTIKDWGNYPDAFVYIGKNNPFVQGELKPFKWTKIKEIPKLLVRTTPSLAEVNLQNSYKYKNNKDISFYYFQEIARIYIINIKENELILYHEFFDGEGSTLSPINYSNKDYPNETYQWTGKLFKDYPPVFFGFTLQSFGCSKITLIQNDHAVIPILCDNRH